MSYNSLPYLEHLVVTLLVISYTHLQKRKLEDVAPLFWTTHPTAQEGYGRLEIWHR